MLVSLVWVVAVCFAIYKPWGPDGILPPKELAWQVGAVLIGCWAFTNGSPPLGWFAIIPALAFFTIFRSGLNPIAVKQIANLYLALLVIVAWQGLSLKSFSWLFNVFLGCALLHLAYAWVQFVHDPLFTPTDLFLREGYVPLWKDRMFGFMGTPAHFCGLLAVAFPITWLWKKWPRRITQCLMMATIVTVQNLSSLLAVMLVCLLRLPRKIAVLAGLFSMGGLVWLSTHHDLGLRPHVWHQTLTWIRDRWIAGYGFGRFGVDYVVMTGQKPYLELWVHPHNEYLHALFVAGIVGGLAIVGFVAWALMTRSMIRPMGLSSQAPSLARVSSAILITLAALGLTQYPWHVAPLALVGVLAVSSLSKLCAVSMDTTSRATSAAERHLQGVSYAV